MNSPNAIVGPRFMNSRWLKYALTVIVLSLDYSAAYTLAAVWQIDIAYSIVAIAIISLIGGALVGHLLNAVIFSCMSLVIGAFLATSFLILPPLVYGDSQGIEITLAFMLPFLLKIFFFGGLAAGFIGGLIGGVLGSVFTEGSSMDYE